MDIGNKQIISIESITNNQIIFKIRDTVGGTMTDSLIGAFKIEMNPTTKQISCHIPNSLFINGVNVMNEIGLKVNIADLSSYALSSSLSPYLKLDINNQLSVPKISLSSVNVGPPTIGTNSAGSRIVLYDLQSGNRTYVNNAIGVDQT